MTPARAALERVRIAVNYGKRVAADVLAWLKRVLGISADLVEFNEIAQAIAAPSHHEADLVARLAPRMIAAAKETNRVAFQPIRDLGKEPEKIVERADDKVTAYLRRYSVRRVKGIRKTTAKTVRAIITRGQKEGLSVTEIAARLRKATRSKAIQARAETIAATEIHAAVERAAFLTAKVSGLKLQKVWASLEDERVRPDHAAADGQVRPLNEPFDVGGEKLMHPGDPNGSPAQVINCRCVCVFTMSPSALGLPRQWRPSTRPAMAEAV